MKPDKDTRTKKQPRKRISGAERKSRLIEAAVDLFSRRGFAGAATKQIADAAGVHEVLLYRDFGTKQGLYTAILDHKAKEARTEESLEELRAFAEKKDDRAFVRCLVGKILDSYRSDPRYQRLMLYAALEGHELSRIFNETRGRPIFVFLMNYVEQRQKDGVFKAGDPRSIAFALFGLPTYYAITQRLFNFDVLQVPDEAAIETFTDLVLDGLRTRDKPASGGIARTGKSRSSATKKRSAATKSMSKRRKK